MSLKGTMLLNNNYFNALVICIIIINIQNISAFVNLPKIVTKDGNLMFYSGQNRNVSFYLNGNSRLKINDDIDLLDLLTNESKNTGINKDLQTCDNNILWNDLKAKLTDLKNAVYGQKGLSQRVQNMQRGSRNVTRKMRIYQNRLEHIEGIVRSISSRVNKDNCESNPCQNGGTCFSLFNKFVCKCTKNFEGATCEKDVNECALFEGTDLGCQNGGQCVNQHAGYSCICNPGWYGIHCTKRQNDCTQSSSWELCGHGICVVSNDNLGYKCICDQGWTKNSFSPSCTIDVDECLNGTTPCITKCINLPGSFACAPCDNGLTGNGINCRDINECAINNGGCSTNPLVACINSYGSFHCGDCPYGWIGDGRTCTRSDNDNSPIGTPCKSSSLCHPAATCNEISNSIICTCPAGMVGNGIGPNGCAQAPYTKCDSKPCLNGGNCINTVSGYTCVCPRGYLQPNCAAPKSACSPNPCQNNAGCRERGATDFQCNCLQGFHGRLCELRGSRCGGTINAETGKIKYPLHANTYAHNEQCAWVLRTNSSKVLNVTFNAFELEHSTECRFDWLQINDGRSAGSQIIGRFCGTKKPLGGNIISTSNALYLWFKSDNSSANAGFELEWNSIPPQCGGILNITTHGTISSPGSPGKYPRNRDCLWRLRAPNTKRIKLTFFSLKLENHSTCNFDYLEITDAISNIELEKYCTTSNPTPLLLSTNEADIRFHSDGDENDYGFQIFYSIEDRIPGCGGIFNAKEGTIISPIIKSGEDISCEYEIQAITNESIIIEFTEFDLIADNCIELYNVNELKGETILDIKYCGNYGFSVPHFQSIYNKVLIKYFTKGGHFELTYRRDCSYTFESDTDIIISPGYSSSRYTARFCALKILTAPGSVIELNIIDFDLDDPSLEDPTTCSSLSYLKMKNGLSGEVYGPFCGNHTPANDYVIKSNMVTLELSTIDSTKGRGFKIQYKSLPMGSADCGGVFTKPSDKIKLPSTEAGTYSEEMACYWIIMAPPSKNIAINWEYFDIEDDDDCSYDYVEIYENIAENNKPLGRYCGSINPPTFISHSRILTLKFVSDDSNAQKGFEASYAFVDKFNCGGTILSSSGELTTPDWPQNYTNNMNCTWIISAPIHTQIELKFDMFDLEPSDNCNRDWLSIRNGGSEQSVLIGNFCGKSVPRAVPSFTNQLRLHFHSDASQTASGFRLSWNVFSNNCGGVLKGETGVITSPFYPNSYPNDAECQWFIHVHKGSTIHIRIEDLEMELLSSCQFDYLEIIDGRNEFGKSFPRICALPDPSHRDFITTQSEAVIRFSTDASNTQGGFLLSYYANCTSLYKNLHGIIESPNYEEANYKNNINCSWTIQAPKGNQIQLQFTYVDDRNENAAIYIINPRNKTLQEIKTIQTINTYGDTIIIKQNSSLISFRLEYAIVGCVGIFKRDTGTLTSPNYPQAYKNEQECFWEIHVGLGKSIELTIAELDIEESQNCTKDYLQVSHHPDSTSTKERHCGKATDMQITSTGSHLFVRFNSDAANNGKGFSATYRTVETKCGGLLKAKNGVIMSPNYPKNYDPDVDCEWTIQVSPSHRIGITLEELDLEETYDCELDFLEAYEIENENDERKLFHICGSTIPDNGYYETNTGTAIIRFKSDGSYESKGFKLTFAELCGMDLTVESYGFFDFIEIPGNHNCLYRFIAKNPEERVMLLITHVHMNSIAASQYHSEEECQQEGVKIYEGSNVTNSVRASFCKIHPETIYSNGHALTMQIPTKTIAEMEGYYMLADSFCGGTYYALKGKFSSPYFPTSYSVNMECEWYITANPGNSIVLTIETLDLEESEYCNKDFLEIRAENNRGTLLGIFCGKEPPPPLTATALWIRFKSDNDIAASGFLASYNYAEHNEMNGTHGIIESPRYPSPFHSDTPYGWRITVDRSSKIFLNLNHLTDVSIPTLKIYDGYSDIGLPIDISNTNLVRSSSNSLYFRAQRGPFSFEWEAIDEWSLNKTTEEIREKCGDLFLVNVDEPIVFNSPGYPNGYENLLECQWKFAAKNPSYHIVFSFDEIDLEESSECLQDYVQISASNDLENWHVLDKICDSSAKNKVYEGTPYLMLTFSTDVSVNRNGFSLKVKQKCGSELIEPRGIINITDLISKDKQKAECIWTIIVHQNRRIRIKFMESNVDKHQTNNMAMSCPNYIIIRNGMSIDSPFLGQGKYCNNAITDVLETSGNRAYIKLVYMLGNFNTVLHYEEIGNECSEEIILTDETYMDRSRIITSPNYPNLPNPHSECIWIIKAPVQHAIAINFVGKFDLAPISGPLNQTCVRENIQLYDGATEMMPLLGHFCGNIRPNSVVTSSNVLRIKYMTDIPEPHMGFKLNVSIATCGGTYYTNEDIIRSPTHFDLHSVDKTNFECIYIIELPQGNTIDLVIKKTILPRYGDCFDETHLELQEIDVHDEKDNITDSLILCGNLDMAHYIVETNKLIVRYKIKELSNYMFEMKYKAIGSRCGETIEASTGVLQSPGYPQGVRQYTLCTWRLRVPKGRRIKIELLDFDPGNRESTKNNTSVFVLSNWRHFNGRLTFANDFNFKSIISRVTNNPPKYIYSSDNIMGIEASLLPFRMHRGFKLRYTSNDNSIFCNDHFNLQSAIDVPQSFNMTKQTNTSYYCSYDINVPIDKTLALHFTKYELSDTFLSVFGTICNLLAPIKFQYNKERILTNLFCQNETSPTARVAFPITMEFFGNRARHLTVEYQLYNCGGLIYKTDEVVNLTQPLMANNYNGRVECVWSILSGFEFGEQIPQFVINLKTDFKDTCEKQYLKIYNGPTQSSPLLNKYCTSSAANNLIIPNGVLIEFYTEQYNRQSNFNLDIREGEVCGGKLSYPYRKISFYTLYKNNVECVWDVSTEPGFTIGLYFEDRFFIESSKDCTKDYLLVLQKSTNGDWEDIQNNKFCGREPPKYINTTSTEMRLIFRSDSQTTGDGFMAVFERNCGGILYADKNINKEIISPGYPLSYDKNLYCNYTIIHADPKDTGLLNVRFVDFELESVPILECVFDNVTIQVYSSSDIIELEKIYCGAQQQLEFQGKEKIEIIFRTDELLSGRGFRFEYGKNKCGGIVEEPTIIATPKGNDNNFPHLSQCYWNITAPPTDKILLKFEILDFESINFCPYDGVEIFSGLKPSKEARVAKLCGNFTGNMPILSIPMNTALIYGYSDMSTASRGFEVVVNFLPNCDQFLFLDVHNSTYDLNTFTSATNANKKLDCNYIFKTLPGRQFSIEFSSFNFKQPINCKENFVELRDGLEPFADEIGIFCETYLPRGLSSSANALFMRFVRQSNDTTIGFQAQIKSVPALCGKHDLQLYDNETLTLKSPDNGAGLYPNNIYCFWSIKSKNLFKIHIEKLEIDTKPSNINGSCGGDFLKIIAIPAYDETDGNERNIYQGDFKGQDLFGNAAEHILCGSILSHDFYPNAKEVKIKFRTDADYAKSGFILKFSAISNCLRNYTGVQGRIVFGEISDYCDVYIKAPANYSLSIYFTSINYFDYSCDNNYLEVFDVHSNKSLEKICSYSNMGKSVFTTTNELHLHLHSKLYYGSLDLTFLASNQGPGCGGDLYNTEGIITSPYYPNEIRNNYDCRWNIRVPSNVHVMLKFEEFQFGSKINCHSDYLQIIEFDDNTKQEVIQRQFCGEDRPYIYKSTKSNLSIRLHKTVNFDGTGFVITFKGVFANYDTSNLM